MSGFETAGLDLLTEEDRVGRFQTVLASPAETPDLGYGVIGTMGSSEARLSVSTSSGGAGEEVPKIPVTVVGLLRWSRARRENGPKYLIRNWSDWILSADP